MEDDGLEDRFWWDWNFRRERTGRFGVVVKVGNGAGGGGFGFILTSRRRGCSKRVDISY